MTRRFGRGSLGVGISCAHFSLDTSMEYLFRQGDASSDDQCGASPPVPARRPPPPPRRGLAMFAEAPTAQSPGAFEYQKSRSAPRFATPEVLRGPRSTAGSRPATPWTVHDGQFFAATFAEEEPKGRAPQERRLQQRGLHQPLLLAREDLVLMGIAPATIERYSLQSAELLRRVSAASTANEPTPTDLKTLGGQVVQLSAFEFDGDLMGSLLGVGAFSSVHRATRTEDGRSVAIKVFHQPVRPHKPEAGGAVRSGARAAHSNLVTRKAAPQLSGSVHGATNGDDPRLRPQPDYVHQDAMCFVREVSCLARMALAHEIIVKYLGHGFVRTADGLAGFIVMELVEGQGRCLGLQPCTFDAWSLSDLFDSWSCGRCVRARSLRCHPEAHEACEPTAPRVGHEMEPPAEQRRRAPACPRHRAPRYQGIGRPKPLVALFSPD